MRTNPDVATRRAALTDTFFPDGAPRLWCPPLTHYRPDGGLDRDRIAAHLAWLRPHVHTFLAPGSTGDGWEMDGVELRALLAVLLDEATRQELWVTIGVLRTGRGEAAATVREVAAELAGPGVPDPLRLAARRVCGFTVTPPRGGGLRQEEIAGELGAVLAAGWPVALYQLPQVTGNEMAPATVAGLAARHPNLVMVKDTSGDDRIALSGALGGGVMLVRGAEGDYHRWLRPAGGPYDGFLLSTANVFADRLAAVIAHVDAGRHDQAATVSGLLTRTVRAAFALVADLPFGNPFSNANRAMDHVMAHGARALARQAPRTHCGEPLPAVVLEATAALLADAGLAPERGYLG